MLSNRSANWNRKSSTLLRKSSRSYVNGERHAKLQRRIDTKMVIADDQIEQVDDMIINVRIHETRHVYKQQTCATRS